MKLRLAGMVLALCVAADSAAGLDCAVQVQAAGVQESAGQAQESSTDEQGNYQYKELNDGTIEITRYKGTDTSLVIPGEIDGKKVTRIGDSSFSECENLQSVEIPDGVVSMADYAFAVCENLKTAVLPQGIKNIGEYAFWGCKSLEKMQLPDSITLIDSNAFDGCTALKDIQLSKNLEVIGMEAFSRCTGLKSISLPENVWLIGETAFAECRNLKRIELPKSLKEIAKSAFAECGSLKDVYYAGSKAARKKIQIIGRGNEDLMSADIHYSNSSKAEVLAPKKGTILKSGQDSYKVKTKVSSVAFYKTTRRDSKITVPEYVVIDGILYDVASVTANAFRDQKKVSKITIQGNINSIGVNAFRGCSGLKTIVIRSSVLTSVGSNAVKGTPADLKIKVPFNQASRYRKMFKGKGLGKKAVIVEY